MPTAARPAIAPGRTGELEPGTRAGVLVTFPMSHYCEKARWALDHSGMTYRERGYPPAVHKLAVHRHGSPTAPVLVGRRTLRGSSEILRFADAACPPDRSLLGADDGARREAGELMAHFDAELGPPVRAWLYAWLLADPARLYEWASCGLSPGHRLSLRLLAPRIAGIIAKRMTLGGGSPERLRELVDEQFQLVASRLADGRRYLCADRFTAADLTFAALAGPVLSTPEYGGDRLTLPPVPGELAPQVDAWRATPAGRHALRVYRDHRGAPTAPQQ